VNPIGYNTGAICRSSTEEAIEMLSRSPLNAIEISSLRDGEFHEVIKNLDTFDVSGYDHISFHAPSRLLYWKEEDVAETLYQEVISREWGIVVHPDIIEDYSLWQKLGQYLRIENMDNNKEFGKTVEDLEKVFKELPEASWCFDIGHAMHLDTSGKLAQELLEAFGDRLSEIHLSYVDENAGHFPLRQEDYDNRDIFELWVKIPNDVSIILEAHDFNEGIGYEIQHVETNFFSNKGIDK